MYRRPLADVQKAFSRLFQQNVHRYTHGWPLRTVRPLHRHERQCGCHCSSQTERPCCLCPVSGHALRAVQPASESACSFLFLQPSVHPSVHPFCTPSVHLLYTFCTPSVQLLHILYISGRSTNLLARGVGELSQVQQHRLGSEADDGDGGDVGETAARVGRRSR